MDKPITCPTLVGRAHERAALRALVDAVKQGQGRVAIISGEAGIGKTRLVTEAKNIALAQDFEVFQGQCYHTDATYPYAPLLDLLRVYLPKRLPQIIAAGQEPLIRDLVRLLPDLALVCLQLVQETGPQATGQVDPEQRRYRVFSILTALFTGQAEQRATLFVMEDMHWCDESSLAFLLHLARRVARAAQAPILLLFTYRSEEIPARLRQWLAQIDQEHLAIELELARLSRPEIDAMVRAILAAPLPVNIRLAESIYAFTEGNPFFTEEVLKSLMTAGNLRIVSGKWHYTAEKSAANGIAPRIPRSIAGAVQQRMEGLSADACKVATVAAVAGRRFDVAVLQRLMAGDESDLIALVKELIAAQLVIEESADQFAFRHALIRQAIYSALLARERRTLHGTIADAMESLYVSPAEREAHLADLAAHFYAAGSWVKALMYKQRACERALTLYAPHTAIEHATHAIEAARHLHMTSSASIYYMRGQAHATLGEFDHARSDYEQALEAARTDADDELRWQCMTALGELWAERDYRQTGRWFRSASDLAEHLDPTMQARSLNYLGNWLGNTGHIEDALKAHQDALAIFVEQRNIQGMAETLDLLSTIHGMGGDRVTAVVELGRAIALFRELGDTEHLISSLAMRALQSMPGANETTFCPKRTRDECVQDVTESLRLSRQIDMPAGQSFAESTLAHVLTSFGEFDTALTHAREAQRIATEIGHQQWLISTYFALGRIHLFLLRPEPAIAALDAGLALARQLGSSFWSATLAAYYARAHILHHDLAAAQTSLQGVMPREQLPRTIPERDVALAWAELALVEREHHIALRIAESLLASAPGQQPGQPAQPIPHVLEVKGEALMGLSRLDEAVAALEDARWSAQQRNARPLLWRIHRSLSRAYQLQQRKDEAQRELAASRHLIEELAATITDTMLRERFVGAARSTLPPEKLLFPRKAAWQTFGGLTAREREVALLVAEGKTSRQIADTLVISERTAEVHVSNILKKLGFTSRTQIAVWVVECGLAQR